MTLEQIKIVKRLQTDGQTDSRGGVATMLLMSTPYIGQALQF